MCWPALATKSGVVHCIKGYIPYISLTLLHHRTKHIKKHKVINIEKKGSDAIDSSQIMHFKNQALYEIRLVGFFSPAEQLICPPKIQKNREPS